MESGKSRFSKASDPAEIYNSNKLPSLPQSSNGHKNSAKFMSKRQLQQSNIFVVDQSKNWNPVLGRRDSSWNYRNTN